MRRNAILLVVAALVAAIIVIFLSITYLQNSALDCSTITSTTLTYPAGACCETNYEISTSGNYTSTFSTITFIGVTGGIYALTTTVCK